MFHMLKSVTPKVLLVASNTGIPRVWRMARSLAKAGLNVTVLEWNRGAKLDDVKDVDNVKVVRFALNSYFGSKAAVWFPFWLFYAAFFAIKNRYSVLQVQNFDNLLLPLALRGIARTKIVYDLADFYADAYIPNSGLVTDFVRCLERRMIRQVDAMIIVSEQQLRQTGSRNLPSCRQLIFNTLMEEEIQEYKSQKEDLGIPKEISLFYAGVLSKDRLQPLLNLLSALEDFHDITIKVAGFGEMEEVVKEKISDLPNAIYVGTVSHSEVMRYTTECDCVVMPYDSSLLNYRIALPNKFFEGLAEGKAVLVPKQTYAANIVEEARCGFSTDFCDINDIKRTLRSLREQKNLLKEMGERGRKLFDQKYNWSLMEERLASLYEYVVGK